MGAKGLVIAAALLVSGNSGAASDNAEEVVGLLSVTEEEVACVLNLFDDVFKDSTEPIPVPEARLKDSHICLEQLGVGQTGDSGINKMIAAAMNIARNPVGDSVDSILGGDLNPRSPAFMVPLKNNSN